ncbi:MAG: sigma-70 family RNA polymerase sigma factor [Hyphomicrobiaceae bacterium]|nr:sigma-70 family RNA polymerase sigma factor [Hyphomicrobiaceae bacterium]MCC0022771.1 sigma-70 family RNA polymerase sigma factor [Hyphomicrobiaceae bacterium]
MSAQTELEALIGQVALRDRVAFRALYDRTSAKLFGVALRILNNRHDAEEALQEIFVKIWQRASQYRSGSYSPISWLVAIARNHALDVVRARRPQTDLIDDAFEVEDDAPTPEQSAVRTSETGRLEDCLKRLEDNRAEAVRLAYLDGFSYQDLSSKYEVPLNTMRTWLRRSLIKLRECLS